jgi:multidrug efflux system outer membrane protein
LFQDETLRLLITTALQHNYNLQIAATHILEARATVGISRADQFPNVTASPALISERTSNVLGFTVGATFTQLQATAAWDADFWGRLRAATAAARAQLLATDWAARAVVTTLVEQVADAYFRLRALDLELDIATRTLASRQESLQLTQIREQGGATSLVDVRQAEQLVSGASLAIVTLRNEITLEENLISELLGNNPGAIPRGRALEDQPKPPEVPPGLPSALLERRPDIVQAEMQLVAATDQVAVARAAYFPQITLTGTGGVQSSALTALFTGGAAMWTAAVGAVVPVFTAGRIRSQVELAQAHEQEATLAYQQTVKDAFREVSDALASYRSAHDFREEQARLLIAARDGRRLADVRYQGGATSYLEVLDADTRLFDAELGFAQAQLNELSTLVMIYRALGGGWQP